MNVSQAFDALDLPDTATEEEINDRYHKVILKEHPDVGGLHERAATLNEAHEIAIAYNKGAALIKTGDALVLARAAAQEVVAHQTRQESSKAAVAQVTEHRTRSLKSFKKSVGMMGAVSAGFGLFANQLFPAIDKLSPAPATGHPAHSIAISTIAAIIAAVFAIYYFIFSQMLQQVEQNVKEVTDILSDKWIFLEIVDLCILTNSPRVVYRTPMFRKDFEREIAATLSAWSDRGFDRLSIEQADRMTLHKFFARRIFPGVPTPFYDFGNDIGKLFLAKGLELGIIEEQETIQDGKRTPKYFIPEK